ncbi:MAG: hypothetical protein LGR52_01070 [Candidatus Thiosymbion ectosymbiont of Robbea hypermnestra]|nr:hypothetical protein [Candidatus Thiosymbion ectosymbiont of Robbea hypermnestra]
MSLETRRGFLAASGKLLVGTVALASVGARASDEHQCEHEHEHEHGHGGSGKGRLFDATAEGICGTCQFWGGMRKISDDKKKVIAQSMGWCNNPASPHHGMLTMADHEMNPIDIWKKWSAL